MAKSLKKELEKLNKVVDRARAKAPRGASRKLKPPVAGAEPVTSDGKTVGWVWFKKGGGQWWHWSAKDNAMGGDCMTKREAFLQVLRASGSLS